MNTTLNTRTERLWPGENAWRQTIPLRAEPARRLYFLDFPLLLLSVGLLTWIIPTDSMLLISALTGALVGLYTFWEIVVRRKAIRFSHVFCIAYTVGYGAGVVNSWLTISRGDLGLAQFFHRDPDAVSHAMAAVLIASAILYSLGEIYEPPVFSEGFRLKLDNRAILFVLLGTALVITGYITGDLGYMGSTAAENNGHLTLLGAVLLWLFPTLFAFTFLCFLEWRKGMAKWFLGVMLAVQFVLIVPTGRRLLLYCVLLAIIATRFSSYKPRWSQYRKFIYAGILLSVVGLGAMAFYYLRYAAWGKKVSLADRVSMALALYQSGDTSKVDQSLKENLQKRTFILGYLSDILDASLRMKPALGQNALHEFQISIPSALWSGKKAILFYGEEQIANETYHFAYIDEANSLYTAGVVDFGIWGMIFYPIIVTVLFRLCSEILRVTTPSVVSTLVSLLLVFNALQTEAGLASYILALRDSVLYAVVLTIFFKIPAFSFARQSLKGVASR